MTRDHDVQREQSHQPLLDLPLLGFLIATAGGGTSPLDPTLPLAYVAALIFLRHGEYLGTIQRVQDWTDYLREIPDILAREPSNPPPFKFPDGCGAPQPNLQH